MKTLVIASHNPVKVQATLNGFERMFPDEIFNVEMVNVPSGVSDQPMSDEETLRGATQRAANAAQAFPNGDYWVGIEGGVAEEGGELSAFAWVVVRGGQRSGKGRTGAFFLPPEVTELVQQGKELGEADDIVFQRRNSKQEDGAIGLLTGGVLDRRQFYEQAVILSLLPFKNDALYPSMQTKGRPPAELLPADSSPLVRACFEANQLKQLYRQGWLWRGIPPERCESVAEHSYGVALLALWLARHNPQPLDMQKTLAMALLHDLGEAYAGDLTPANPTSAREKHELEAQSIARILARLAGGEEWLALWQEYEENATPEARFVRQVDRLEMAVQAGVYERLELNNDLSEFFASARRALSAPHLLAALDEIEATRPTAAHILQQ